jgi:hypothetical protein
MNYHNVTTQISYGQTKLTNVTESKFLGLIIDSTISWKQHIDCVIKKISNACYALRNIKYFIPLDTLIQIYFAHIHSIISYGIIIWGGSSCVQKFYILQKKTIRIITNSRTKESCGDLFKNSKIMTFSQYIYSLVLFTIHNDHLFNSNNEIHSYKTRAHCNLHLPAVNLTKYSKGAYVSGIKAFNHLQSIKRLGTDEASIKCALMRFLYRHSGVLSTQLALSI